MKTTLLILFLLSVVVVADAAVAAPPQKTKPVAIGEAPLVTERGQAKRLFVVGFAGQVNIIPLSRGDQITVKVTKYMDKQDAGGNTTDALNQLIVRATNLGSIVEVRAQLPPNGADWAKWVQGHHVPQARLDIAAPENMNLEIYWAHGDVHVPQWKSSVLVTAEDSHVSISDVIGDVTVRNMVGSIQTDGIKGTVTVENFSSGITAADITGKVKIRNFSGETHVKKVTGPVYVSSQKGPVTIQDTQGNIEVQTGVAAIHVLEHKGSIVGHSDAGPINVKLSSGDLIDTRLTSVSGALSLSLPHGSQASVNLFTTDGHLTAPSSLEEKKEAAGHWVRGRLNGGETGRVKLTSESGDLVLKVM